MNPDWPKLEAAETEKQITVSAEIQGMEDKDVEVLLNDGQFDPSRRNEIRDGGQEAPVQ